VPKSSASGPGPASPVSALASRSPAELADAACREPIASSASPVPGGYRRGQPRAGHPRAGGAAVLGAALQLLTAHPERDLGVSPTRPRRPGRTRVGADRCGYRRRAWPPHRRRSGRRPPRRGWPARGPGRAGPRRPWTARATAAGTGPGRPLRRHVVGFLADQGSHRISAWLRPKRTPSTLGRAGVDRGHAGP
jgi:hypothetical protein